MKRFVKYIIAAALLISGSLVTSERARAQFITQDVLNLLQNIEKNVMDTARELGMIDVARTQEAAQNLAAWKDALETAEKNIKMVSQLNQAGGAVYRILMSIENDQAYFEQLKSTAQVAGFDATYIRRISNALGILSQTRRYIEAQSANFITDYKEMALSADAKKADRYTVTTYITNNILRLEQCYWTIRGSLMSQVNNMCMQMTSYSRGNSDRVFISNLYF